MSVRPRVVIGQLGSTLDAGFAVSRWERWRPTVALHQHPDLKVDRLELLYQPAATRLLEVIIQDIQQVSPETLIRPTLFPLADPWDFEEVFGALHDYARAYPFDPDAEDYLFNITTGTHVFQICAFLLAESRHLPTRLLQLEPSKDLRLSPGGWRVIDLDLSQYDRLASRFAREQAEGLSALKSGIDTRSRTFNSLIAELERVAVASRAPILLMGPTGAGKSQLARKIYELKKARRQISGPFVEVNCATLRGDSAMSALFGHTRGAFTGAVNERLGHLRRAHEGLLFLDEIGELGLDEQAMLLRAIEEKLILPVGADKEVHSDFLLIAGTNRDLFARVQEGAFREDLLARIDLWTFELPGLKDRPEDLEPNIQYELDKFAREQQMLVSFSKEARARFLAFARSSEASWTGNFRDLNASLTRMATLAQGGRITVQTVEDELLRLKRRWRQEPGGPKDGLEGVLSAEQLGRIDRFDRVQLAEVVRVCQRSRTLSEAGRELFQASRQSRQSINDSDRLRKYLARFGLEYKQLVANDPTRSDDERPES